MFEIVKVKPFSYIIADNDINIRINKMLGKKYHRILLSRCSKKLHFKFTTINYDLVKESKQWKD